MRCRLFLPEPDRSFSRGGHISSYHTPHSKHVPKALHAASFNDRQFNCPLAWKDPYGGVQKIIFAGNSRPNAAADRRILVAISKIHQSILYYTSYVPIAGRCRNIFRQSHYASVQKTFIVDLNSYVGILDTVKQGDLSFA